MADEEQLADHLGSLDLEFDGSAVRIGLYDQDGYRYALQPGDLPSEFVPDVRIAHTPDADITIESTGSETASQDMQYDDSDLPVSIITHFVRWFFC
jgi:hypothetical protein